MTPQELFQIRARQHQAEAELLQAIQALLDEIETIREQRDKLAETTAASPSADHKE